MTISRFYESSCQFIRKTLGEMTYIKNIMKTGFLSVPIPIPSVLFVKTMIASMECQMKNIQKSFKVLVLNFN